MVMTSEGGTFSATTTTKQVEMSQSGRSYGLKNMSADTIFISLLDAEPETTEQEQDGLIWLNQNDSVELPPEIQKIQIKTAAGTAYLAVIMNRRAS